MSPPLNPVIWRKVGVPSGMTFPDDSSSKVLSTPIRAIPFAVKAAGVVSSSWIYNSGSIGVSHA